MHTHTHAHIQFRSSPPVHAFQTTFFLRQAYWCLYAHALHSAKNKIDVGGGTQWWDLQIIKLFRRQLVCICTPAILGSLFVESLKFLFEQYVYPCEKNWQPKKRFWCCVGIKSPSLHSMEVGHGVSRLQR